MLTTAAQNQTVACTTIDHQASNEAPACTLDRDANIGDTTIQSAEKRPMPTS
jgi:hypothetical protein